LVALRFNADGTVTIWHHNHLVRQGLWWKIAVPRTVELVDAGGSRDLHFDLQFASFSHLTGAGTVHEVGARADDSRHREYPMIGTG
jgi:hypothetical protein